MKKSFGIIGLLTIICIIFGCVSFDNSIDNPIYYKGFSKGGLSFQYPSNWKESDSNFGDFQSLDGASLYIHKISLAKTQTIQEYKDLFKQDLLKSKTTILNETNLNINDLTIYEITTSLNSTDIGSLNNPFLGSNQMDLFVLTGKDQNVYIMEFSTPDASSFSSHLSEFNQVISTIKII